MSVRGFERADEGYTAHMDGAERGVFASVTREVLALVRSVEGAPSAEPEAIVERAQDAAAGLPSFSVEAVPTPDDSALRRLFPAAVRDDDDASAEFRRFAQPELASAKVARLERLAELFADDAPTLVVDRAEAREVAAALTDVRLVVADRLGVVTDADAERVAASVYDAWDGDAEEAPILATVHVLLTVLQDTLVEEMLADLRGRR
ncbi:hypothetical protein GCM10011331_02590 [Flavimobilis marinus]|nr:hypothetical protein GCM10011331_02590 [Flavimobilis marinus]